MSDLLTPNRRAFLKACGVTFAGGAFLGQSAIVCCEKFTDDMADANARKLQEAGYNHGQDIEMIREHLEYAYRMPRAMKALVYALGGWVGLETYLKNRAGERQPDIY